MGSLLITRRMRNHWPLTGYLNIVARAAIVLPTFNPTQNSFYTLQIHQNAHENIPDETSSLAGRQINSMPDICYIITDANARADIPEEFYDCDNGAFIHFLQDRSLLSGRKVEVDFGDYIEVDNRIK